MFACLTASQLKASGMTTYQIRSAEKCCLRRIRRGVYVAIMVCEDPAHRFIADIASAASTDLPVEEAGLRKRTEDLRIVVRSYAHGLPPRATLSHRSALIVHGLPVPYWEEREQLCVETVHPTHGVRRTAMHIRRRSVDEADVVDVDGIRVTSVARTLYDIARDCPLAFAVAVIDDAVRRSLITLSDLREYCAARAERSRRGRVASVLDNVDGRRETVAESICAVRFVEHSVTGFEPQVVIVDEQGNFVARTDFGNEQSKVIAEFDGAGKYYLENADPKRAFELERQREYALRNLGYVVFRVTWRDLFSADLFLRIKQAVQRRTPVHG